MWVRYFYHCSKLRESTFDNNVCYCGRGCVDTNQPTTEYVLYIYTTLYTTKYQPAYLQPTALQLLLRYAMSIQSVTDITDIWNNFSTNQYLSFFFFYI